MDPTLIIMITTGLIQLGIRIFDAIETGGQPLSEEAKAALRDAHRALQEATIKLSKIPE